MKYQGVKMSLCFIHPHPTYRLWYQISGPKIKLKQALEWVFPETRRNHRACVFPRFSISLHAACFRILAIRSPKKSQPVIAVIAKLVYKFMKTPSLYPQGPNQSQQFFSTVIFGDPIHLGPGGIFLRDDGKSSCSHSEVYHEKYL